MAEVDKNKLRTVYLRKRKFLSQKTFEIKNLKVYNLFKKFLEDKNCKSIHVFLPIKKQYEVDTWSMIEEIKNHHKQVVVSRSDLNSNQMEHFIFEDKSQLEINKWGIPEPIQGQKIDIDQIDMVLVPLIVFDRFGHRIGYGKGYYDRFLSECRSDCLKVGLSLSPPLDYIPYIEETDIALDYCITPSKVYHIS